MTELFELSMTSAIRSLEGNRIKEMLLSRPDLIRRLDPNLIFSPGEGNPPSVRIDTTLPPLPEAVDPGDLIRAEDWNALLARLTALEPVLANLADVTVSLATRVLVLERKLAAIPVPPKDKPDPRDILGRVLGDREVVATIASKRDLVEKILADTDVVEFLGKNPRIFEDAVINPAFDPGPEVFAGPEAQQTATARAGQLLVQVDELRQVFEKSPELVQNFGVKEQLASVDKAAGVNQAAPKANIAKAGGAKAAPKANIAKPGVAKPGGGGQ